MRTTAKELAYAVRQWTRAPALTGVAILTLALGVGASTAIFSLVNAVFLRPPADVHEPERIVSVYSAEQQSAQVSGVATEFLPVSFPNFRDLREMNETLDRLAAYCWMRVNLQDGGDTDQLWGEIVTADYFALLGVEAHLGRVFRPEESTPGGHPVVVLGHGLWRRMFGGDPEILGRTLQINGHDLTVVGVAPPGFHGVNHLAPKELWVPMAMHEQVFPMSAYVEDRAFRMFNLVGRLAEGAGVERAQAEMAGLARRLREEFPEANEGKGLNLVALEEAMVDPTQRRNLERAGIVLLAAVGLVLVIACGNLANLLLARATARRGEMSLRLALGASRQQLARQLLLESGVLALSGGAVGVLLGAWTVRLLWRFKPHYFPESGLDLGLDLRVLLFALGVTIATGLLFGIAPALRASRSDLVSALGQERGVASFGRRYLRPRDLLVIFQVALCVMALVGAALFWRSLENLKRVDTGFSTESTVLLSYDLAAHEVPPTQGREFHRRVLERIRSVPGVASAALGQRFPLNAAGLLHRVVLEGEGTRGEESPHLVRSDSVTPGYFETLGISLQRGRRFDRTMREDGRQVVIVNETMASRFWPEEDPIGRRFRLADSEDFFHVVGVVEDAKYVSITESPQPFFYLPMEQSYAPAANLVVRTRGDPWDAVPSLRQAVRELDPNLPLENIMTGYGGPTTLAQVVRDSLWGQTLATALLGAFGLLALVFTVTGIFGVLGYTIGQRRREIGVRMAFGAEKSDVLGLVLRQGMAVVAIGLVLGIVGSALLARLSASLLYGLRPTDPLTYGVVVSLLAVLAATTTLVQAYRAARVDPVQVMKV